MRKHPKQLQRSHKENRYDQFTNLGIDLQYSLNRSIVLPKICNKIANIEASEYAKQRRAYEDKEMNLLKNEINRLRRKIHLIDGNKVINRTRTEDQDYLSADKKRFQPYKSILQLIANPSIRNTPDVMNSSRYQANTEKSNVLRKDTKSAVLDQQQIKIASSIVQAQSKYDIKIENLQQNDEKRSFLFIHQSKAKNKKYVKSNGRLKRKFRIAAYVVYFSLFLPAFAKKHYQNRLKMLIRQYPHQVDKYSKDKTEVTISRYKLDEAKLWNFFQQKLDILDAVQKSNLAHIFDHGQEIKLIKDHFQFLINNQLSSNSEKQFKQQNTFEELVMNPKNLQYILQGYQTIFSKFLDSFDSFVNRSDFFLQRWKTFSLGIMNNAFVHNSHPKLSSKIVDSGIIRLHPFKEILLVYDQQTECLLLCYDIMCRIFAYKWMVKLEKLKKQDHPEISDEVIFLANFAVTIFYLIFENLLDSRLKEFTNQNGDPSNAVKNRNQYIRPIVPLIVKSGRRRESNLLKTDRLISNPVLEKQALQALQSNSSYVITIQARLKNIGYELFDKIKTKMNEQRVQTKLQTLNEGNIFFILAQKNTKNEVEIQESQQNSSQSSSSSVSIQKKLTEKQNK